MFIGNHKLYCERQGEIHKGKISKTLFDYLPKISMEGIPRCYISKIQG
jgi:hypothetical protein